MSEAPARVVGMSKKSRNHPSRAKQKQRDNEIRRAKSVYLESQRPPASARFWHGGIAGLEPGSVLLGRAEAETEGIDLAQYDLQVGYEMGVTNPNRVYFSSDCELARGFAGRIQIRDTETGIVFRHGTLYEVEPLGEIERDPDGAGNVSWCTPKARVLAVVEENVRLNSYEVMKRLGPNMTWSDGSPIYSPEGRFIPSPEQRASGSLNQLAALSRTFPWTPVEYLNAWMAGKPSGDRPDPTSSPGILLAAAEGGQVLQRHFERATSAQDSGITFVHGMQAHTHRAAVNDLFSLAGSAEVQQDDDRGLVVVMHPRDGVIGAVLFTAFAVGPQSAMMLDAISVAPAWRGRGIGSVSLITAQQLLPSPPSIFAGHCSTEVAGFFAQAGYTVLRPGIRLVMPLSDEPAQIDIGAEHCWFYRQGPV